MHNLSNAALLQLWESGRGASNVERGLLLLAAALPSLGEAALAECSLAQRDAAVLALRCRALGSVLCGLADCPRCGEHLEFEVDGTALLSAHAPPDDGPVFAGGMRFRLPNSADLVAASAIADEAAAAQALLRRCCVEPGVDASWSDGLLEEVERALAERAGAADMQLGMVCAACGHGWQAPFDVCSYFWEEIDRRAQGLLDEVHCLALAYGWTEPAVLALSDARRAAYLARCDA